MHIHYAAIAIVIAIFATQAKARELYPGQYANAPHRQWYESQRNKAGSSCCLEADAHDYFGDYAINPDGSVLLKSGAIPYRIEPTKSSMVQIQRGTLFGGLKIMATGGLRRSASRRAREVEMRLNDPTVYLRMRGYTGKVVLECVACPTQFNAKDGLAFPAVEKNGEAVMAAFCCARCYLQAIPLTLMGRA